jgi:hypothetical protein
MVTYLTILDDDMTKKAFYNQGSSTLSLSAPLQPTIPRVPGTQQRSQVHEQLFYDSHELS